MTTVSNAFSRDRGASPGAPAHHLDPHQREGRSSPQPLPVDVEADTAPLRPSESPGNTNAIAGPGPSSRPHAQHVHADGVVDLASPLPGAGEPGQAVHSYLAAASQADPTAASGTVRCGGCKEVIDQSSGGVVVAFGNALWHTDCFRCAKCGNKVTADTNLLLLSDGSPVCSACSFQCFVCKKPITEEAIMTGDESYHAACFTCRTCTKRIEELVFAKTSQGIYCMSCHNERVARSRRHAEAKRQKQKEREQRKGGENGGVTPNRERSVSDLRKASRPTSIQPPPGSEGTLQPAASDTGPQSASPSLGSLRAFSPTPSASRSPRIGITPSASSTLTPEHRSLPPSPSYDQTQNPGTAPLSWREGHSVSAATSPRNSNSADSFCKTPQNGTPPFPPVGGAGRRDSGDDVAPLRSDVFGGSAASSPPVNGGGRDSPRQSGSAGRAAGVGLGVGSVNGLNVPTSRADKRRSVNPAFSLAAAVNSYSAEQGNDGGKSNNTVNLSENSGRLSPHPPSPLRSSFTEFPGDAAQPAEGQPTMRSAVSPSPAGRRSPRPVDLASPQQAGSGPPRSSSLADSLNVQTAGAPRKVDSPGGHADASPATLRKADLGADSGLPKIDAPELPAMHFSLSDPDFAHLLRDSDGSPIKKPPAGSHEREAAGDVPKIRAGGASAPPSAAKPSVQPVTRLDVEQRPGSVPSSPLSATSPTFAPNQLRNGDQGGHALFKTDVFRSSSGSTVQRFDSHDSTTASASGHDYPESVLPILQALVAKAGGSEEGQVQIDLLTVHKAIREIEHLTDSAAAFRQKYVGAKRTSQHYIDGLSVAADVYEKEVAQRLDAEAEVARLRAQVHERTARLSVIAGDERRQANLQRRSRDLASNLSGLEKDISKLKAERDMTLAEVTELGATKQDEALREGDAAKATSTLARSLTNRMNKIKDQYKDELEPLTMQREALAREISELTDSRNQFLEESTALAAKNDELAELNTRLSRQAEILQEGINRSRPSVQLIRGHKSHLSGSPSMSSLTTSTTLHETISEESVTKTSRSAKPDAFEQAAPAARNKFKWYKSSKGPDPAGNSASIPRPMGMPPERGKIRPSHDVGQREHIFQQHTILRFSRCEHCGEKLWGLQELRCAVCGIVCHSKCAERLQTVCNAATSTTMLAREDPSEDAPPSIFGRDLATQIKADGQDVPVIVAKCIDAVEAQAMTYEGVYRKTGGSSQSKYITQLFDRGNYDSFDLRDMDKFNDINSITSVMKSYFRSLPNPLLTHELHEDFVAAANNKDLPAKHAALMGLIEQLPAAHYNTLRALMLHLNKVKSFSKENLMHSRNLGVVFGPTLMRSADPSREFGDMAGKALTVEWMVDNAPQAFPNER